MIKDELKEKYHRMYSVWSGMKQRCTNPNSMGYENYGGRGITFCEEWKNFHSFCEWALSHGYSDNLTLERIDVNKNYCPENCTWIPLSDQPKNTRNNYINKYLTVNGETKSFAEWAENVGITPRRLYWRIKRGTPIEEAVTKPRNQRGKYVTINGETKSVLEWIKIYGISKSTFIVRVRHGMTPQQAITLPKRQGVHHVNRLNEQSEEA